MASQCRLENKIAEPMDWTDTVGHRTKIRGFYSGNIIQCDNNCANMTEKWPMIGPNMNPFHSVALDFRVCFRIILNAV